ncbi:MAG: LamG domain-containing protein [Bacteroidota bacterium]
MNIFKHLLPFAIGFLVILGSCNDNQSEQPTGQISLSVIQKAIKNGRLEVDENPVSISITINKGDETILDNEQYDISQFGTGFLIDPIVLEIGEYTVEEFLVYNASNEVIFATPKTGSQFEKFVDTPLPTGFTISADEVSELSLEVISTEGIDPEDLGYASIGFDILPVKNILVSVFSQAESTNSFIASELTIFGDNDSINTVSLGDSINVVKVRDDYDNVSFEFNASGFSTKSVTIAGSDLDNYTTTPLEIIFSDIELNRGLVAHYPFDGNANDNGENNLNGTVFGATLTADRDGNANSAYSFDGIDDRIEIANNSLLENQSYTISTWVNSSSLTGAILSMSTSDPFVKNNSGYYLSILNGNFRGLSNISSANWASVINSDVSTLNNWHHVIFTYDGNDLKLFIDGTEVASEAISHVVNYSEGNPLQIGFYATQSSGNYFSGSIDDVRIYNRHLNNSEITALANE